MQTPNDVNQEGLWDVDGQLELFEDGDRGQVDPAHEAGDGLTAAELWPDLVKEADQADRVDSIRVFMDRGYSLDAACILTSGLAVAIPRPADRCAVCARLKCETGHNWRLEGTPRPRGEIQFPAGSLVQVMAGPVSAVGRLGVVEDVESRTMRLIRLGRDGAGVDYVRVGLRGLRLYVGGSAL